MARNFFARRSFAICAVIICAGPAVAENLHRKFGPSWDCGYITAGLPYYDKCNSCEAEGKEFDQIGNSGKCVPKAGLGNYEPLKPKIDKRLKDLEDDAADDESPGSQDAPDARRRAAPQALPNETPAYGKSGVSSSKGGTIRSPNAGTPATSARARFLDSVKPALTHMKGSEWDRAAELLEPIIEQAREDKRDLDNLHARLLHTIATRERDLAEALVNENDLRTGKSLPRDEMHERGQRPLLQNMKASFALVSGTSFEPSVEPISEKAQQRSDKIGKKIAAVAKSYDMARSKAGDITYDYAASDCRGLGGVLVDDIIRGSEERATRTFCTVKPIPQQEVYELIREYEKAMAR